MLVASVVPVETMPGWAQAITPGIPTYWAMGGFRDIILEGAGLTSVLRPAAVLVGCGAPFTGLAAWLFRFRGHQVYFS